ncbi:carboxylesterase [Micromonospora echinospora]|uniref:CubicO group peptidase, beta-lactamase class C family n=1 Tax=Micromonospora echinospora TaxID=1877 RepID=A0A1C4W0Q0_MICEC|nr:serine hydrolase domain-containing protein [Micromonospora echinospora]OZV80152.1 carboxylesterase [Micromonospora echinospora]SCE89792.1 CubicO group peptidase, beta-lactamase class C family [Micromonospora echinospora]
MRARFAAVHDCFHDLFASGRETGAALAVRYDGQPVVDLVGGSTRPAGGGTHPADEPRRAGGDVSQADTLVNVYSVGKPVAALCLLLLVDRGRLDLDDPVVRHWPQFRTPATVRQVLAHTAGLPVFPVPRPAPALGDWALLTGDLAAAEPEWEPGTVAGEHALTYGHLVGELVRRVDGRTVGRFLAEEIAGPWRLDLAFGLEPADQRRCADLSYGVPDWPVTTLGVPGSLRERALGNPVGCLDLAVLNSPLWRGAEIPAVNLHATATGLARLYDGLLAGGALDGVRLFAADLVAEATRVQYDGPDLLLASRTRWTLGMQYEEDGSWGMGGIGGSCAWADPVRGYTLAYTTSRLAGFDRVEALVDALHSCF